MQVRGEERAVGGANVPEDLNTATTIAGLPGTVSLMVRRMTLEARGVVSVNLVRPDGGDLPEWTPGAHVDLVLKRDMVRSYSLCGSTRKRNEWEIAVLREPLGRGGSEYVHTVLRPGMRLASLMPRNDFPLLDADAYLFVAGGIGITPILPMIAKLHLDGSTWRLLYGGRARESMAFLDRLEGYGDRVAVQPEDEEGLLPVDAVVASAGDGSAVYCCGPEALIAAVEASCVRQGVAAPIVERFGRKQGFSPCEEQCRDGFELALARSGIRVTVPRDKTIVEVLKDVGVWVPTSCAEGYCGTCETTVVSGIPDHRDDFLSEQQRASNITMMPCVSRAKSEELTLDL